MILGNPLARHFLWLGVGITVLLIYEVVWAKRAIARIATGDLIGKIIKGYSPRKKLLKRMFVAVAILLVVFAWMLPRVGRGMRIVKREGVDIAIALDVSLSMYAEDIKPNRLQAAKEAIKTLVSRLGNDRVALVGFAGDGFVHCPLTLDHAALFMFLDFLSPEIISEQGTDIGKAIRLALKALHSAKKAKVIVIFTDGEDHGGYADKAAREAASAGARIYTVGIGTQSGEPIPVKDASGGVSDYKRDSSGEVVISRLDRKLLEDIAQETGGKFFMLGTTYRQVEKLRKEINALEKSVFEERTFEDYVDLFQVPLGLALILLVAEGFISERKRRNA